MQPAEAELLYIKEVEKLDSFGQESFLAKVDKFCHRYLFFFKLMRQRHSISSTFSPQDNYTNDIFIGVSFIGLFVKHRNGRSIMLHK